MRAFARRLRSTTAATGLALALLGGCSGLDREEFTGKLADGVCDKAWQCLEPEVIESSSTLYGRSRAECSATYEMAYERRCPAGSAFDEDQAQKCLDQIGALPCPQLKLTGALVLPYACTLACRAPATDAGGTDAGRPRTDGSVFTPTFDAGDDAEPPAGEPDAASPVDAGVDAPPADASSEPDASVDAGA